MKQVCERKIELENQLGRELFWIENEYQLQFQYWCDLFSDRMLAFQKRESESQRLNLGYFCQEIIRKAQEALKELKRSVIFCDFFNDLLDEIAKCQLGFRIYSFDAEPGLDPRYYLYEVAEERFGSCDFGEHWTGVKWDVHFSVPNCSCDMSVQYDFLHIMSCQRNSFSLLAIDKAALF